MPHLMKQTVAPEPIDTRILNTALDLFVERGYHNVSVHGVQRQANVSIGSIYSHLEDEGITNPSYHHGQGIGVNQE